MRIGELWRSYSLGTCCAAVVALPLAQAQPLATGSPGLGELTGRELIYAVAYDEAARDGPASFMELGRVELKSNRTFRTTRFVFHPNRNPQPILSGRREPYTGKDCVSQRIRVPAYQRSDEFQGTWDLTGDQLALVTRDARDKPVTQTWRLTKADKKLFTLASLSDHAPPALHGYAFVSERPTTVAPVKGGAKFQPVYTGEIQQKVLGAGTSWKRYTFGFSFAEHKQSSTGVYRNRYTGDGGKTYGFSTLSFNAFRYSRDIFTQTFGTDFNKNGCFDDAGHSALYWGAEDATGQVRGAVVIEQSYGVDGAIISVGHVE